ncbi:MAG: hypothetical protein ABI651_18370, partial [Verrucomicrobiota bacterium]
MKALKLSKDCIKLSLFPIIWCSIFISMPSQLAAQPVSEPLSQFWRADGFVNAVVITNNVAYIGGDFTYLGPATGAAGLLETDFGDPLPGFPTLVGSVRTVIPDGSGGWYAGGLFVPAGSTNLQNLVHVRADKTLDLEFKPNPDATVRALALTGGALLVGGEFFQIANNQQSSYFALLNPTTGETNGVRIRFQYIVAALAVDGDTVYVGGQFSTVTILTNGNQQVSVPQQRLAAIKPATGELLAWNPTCTGGSEGVKAIAVTSTTVYVGGDFTQCGTKPRNCIAALSKTDGIANTWNPNAQNPTAAPSVNALAVVGNVLYAGGDFTTIGARSRTRLAALSATGFGQADATWQADANDVVTFIVPNGPDLLVGGKFTVIGGSITNNPVNNQPVQTGGASRRGFAQIAQATAAVSDFGPQVSLLRPTAQFGAAANATSWAMAIQGNEILLAGDFISFGGVNRARIAAIDLSTGAPTAWDPGADLSVKALALGRDGLYVGGSFTNIGGQSRPRIALLKYDSGQADLWDAHVTAGQFVSAIAVGTNTIYVGGQFSHLGGQDRSYLAELSATTGDATAWNPQPGGLVNAMLYSNGQIYVGGSFSGISGGSQTYLALLTASVDPAKILVKTFDAKPDNQVRALALSSDGLFVGGDFSKISGQDRKALAVIDPATALETSNPLDAGIGGNVQLQARAVLPLGQAVYIGGSFTGAGGENRRRIASVNPLFGGASSGWDPGADAPVNAIARNDNIIMIGGEFTRLGLRGPNPNQTLDGQPVPYLAAFDAHPAIHNFRKSAPGHYKFEITDGDGLGSKLLIQASETLTTPNWQTVGTPLDILGIQDPFDEAVPPLATSR